MNEVLKSTGSYIIGWNDILGFESLLERVRKDYLEKEIVARLDDLRDNIVRDSLIDEAQHEDVIVAFKSIEIRVISDTLAVICPVTVPAWRSWLAFLKYSSTLNASMFDIGLPLRGAIAVGDLCVRDWGVFGEPVARAHKACEALDLSACVLLPDTVDAMHAAFCAPEAPQRQAMLTAWYDVPVKPPGKVERHLVQLFNKGFFQTIERASICDYTCDKFRLHNKSIDNPSVQRKLDNTISFLQWNRWLWEHGIQDGMLKTIQQPAAGRVCPN